MKIILFALVFILFSCNKPATVNNKTTETDKSTKEVVKETTVVENKETVNKDVVTAEQNLPEEVKEFSDTTVLGQYNGNNFTVKDLKEKYKSMFETNNFQQLKNQNEFDNILVTQHGLEKILAKKAQEEGLKDHQALLDKITSKTKEPNEKEIKEFYEKYKAQFESQQMKTIEEAKQTIIDYLQDQQKQTLAFEYVENLKKETNFKVSVPYPDFPKANINIENTPILGNKDAKIQIVVFSDFQCPFCSKMGTMLHEVEKKYADKVAISFKNFPLNFHQMAFPAAVYARCALKQGKFWELHDKIFANQKDLTEENLNKWAEELKIDTAKVKECITSKTENEVVTKEISEAEKLGIQGTPSVFINGIPFSGNTAEQIFATVENELNPQPKGKLENNTVVLTFKDEKITWEEITKANESKIQMNKIQSLKAESEFLSKTVSQYVSEKLLSDEAVAQKFPSMKEYMESILNTAKEPTDEEAKAFYESMKDKFQGASFEQVKQYIMPHLKQQKQQEIAKAKMQELYVKYKVLVKIPEIEMPIIKISEEDTPIFGNKDAKITLVEFSDFQCPYCSQYAGFAKEVAEKYKDKVKVVFKHFPLPFHQEAFNAAIVAQCAFKQGKFAEMHDKLFENQAKLSTENYSKWAADIKLNKEEFDKCITDPKIKEKISNELKEAQDIGIQGTPTFYLNGKPYKGEYSVESFGKIIETLK